MLSQSRLGFGLMRLPKDENGEILQEQVNEMTDAFMQAGFTYFDTAYAYAGSEEAIRKALVERYERDAFTLADKLPAWKIKKPSFLVILLGACILAVFFKVPKGTEQKLFS